MQVHDSREPRRAWRRTRSRAWRGAWRQTRPWLHVCVVLWLVSWTQAVRAADFSTGGTFLRLGHGARAHGLGGAGVALLRDDAAVYWNAANLAWLQPHVGVTFMHATILPGVTDGYRTGSAAHAVGPLLGELGQPVRPHRFGYGAFLSNMGFDFESGLRWSETTFLAGAGYAFTNFASIGASLKSLRVSNDFQSADASGEGLDLALTVLVTNWLSAAIVGHDVWTRVRWDTSTSETLEPAMTLGFEVRPASGWAALLDILWRESATQRVSLGVEWQAYREMLWLRGGLTTITPGETRTYPSFGLGVHHRRILVDYGASFDGGDSIDTVHRFSLGVQF